MKMSTFLNCRLPRSRYTLCYLAPRRRLAPFAIIIILLFNGDICIYIMFSVNMIIIVSGYVNI